MKCLHCRHNIFAWARRCDHCGAAIPPSVLAPAPNARTTAAPDLAAIRAVMPLRDCDCMEQDEPTFHPEVQNTQAEGCGKQLLELIEIAAAEAVSVKWWKSFSASSSGIDDVTYAALFTSFMS